MMMFNKDIFYNNTLFSIIMGALFMSSCYMDDFLKGNAELSQRNLCCRLEETESGR